MKLENLQKANDLAKKIASKESMLSELDHVNSQIGNACVEFYIDHHTASIKEHDSLCRKFMTELSNAIKEDIEKLKAEIELL